MPENLRGLLHADIVSDLDVMSEQNADLAARYRAIMEEKDDSLLLAVAQLEDIVAETSAAATCRRRSGRPRPARRAAPPSVLRERLRPLSDEPRGKRPRRALRARLGHRSGGPFIALAHLPRHGRPGRRRGPGPRLHRAGPHKRPGLQRPHHLLRRRRHYDRIIDVARDALRVAVTGNDIAYVYYRLAFAYWQTGRLPEALACYLRVPETSPMGEAALRERNDLVSKMGNNVPGSDWDPTACLRTAGVPLAPLDDVMEVVGRALIELCDANMPLAAAPLASLVASTQHNDILHAVAASLRQGV
ncbi:MAG: tetratricopeptide repeat protein [Adlercreutzia equolifaciens]